jgi:hypothetical protein
VPWVLLSEQVDSERTVIVRPRFPVGVLAVLAESACAVAHVITPPSEDLLVERPLDGVGVVCLGSPFARVSRRVVGCWRFQW